MAKKSSAGVWRYVKNGEWVDGVPTRDLTEAEWEALPKERRELAQKLNLFVWTSAEVAPKEGE